jgi:hypothetical protein
MTVRKSLLHPSQTMCITSIECSLPHSGHSPTAIARDRRGLIAAGRSGLTNPVGLETGRPH